MADCICDDGPEVSCLYHGDTTRLAGGKVLPWPADWPIPKWDKGHRLLNGQIGTYGDYDQVQLRPTAQPMPQAPVDTQQPDG